MTTNKLWFNKYRYWLLSTYATGELNEDEKNKQFCEKFFKTQDVIIGANTYKIRQLFNENEFFFGQIGKFTKAHLNEDTGAKIEPVETDDNPFLYYFAIARKGYQVIYVQRDSKNILGTTCHSIERKLSEIAYNVASPLMASVSCIVNESNFWESIHYFKIIDKIEFTFTRPNFLECDESISELLIKLKKGIDSDVLNIGYSGDMGLKIDDNNEEIKAQATYSSEYSGDWKVKGRVSEQSKQETHTKASVFKAVLVEVPKMIDNVKDRFSMLKRAFDEQDSNKNS